IVEMRQVDERELRSAAARHALPADHLCRAAGDPLRARQARRGAPESAEGKVAKARLELVGQAGRGAEDIERLVAIRAVVGFGGDVDIDGGALVEPPEEFGAAERSLPRDGALACRRVKRLGLQ